MAQPRHNQGADTPQDGVAGALAVGCQGRAGHDSPPLLACGPRAEAMHKPPRQAGLAQVLRRARAAGRGTSGHSALGGLRRAGARKAGSASHDDPIPAEPTARLRAWLASGLPAAGHRRQSGGKPNAAAGETASGARLAGTTSPWHPQ